MLEHYLDVSLSTDPNIELGFEDFVPGGGGPVGDIYTDDVYFKKNVTCAGKYTQVGNITKGEDEVTTIPVKGKTLTDFIKMVFTKEMQPTIVEPSVSVLFPQLGEYEVGTRIIPTYEANFDKGLYSYGPDTGVEVTSWNIKDSIGNTSTNPSDSFSEILVDDKTSYSITAKANYTDGVTALTNLGNDSTPIQHIVGGSKSTTTSSIIGYRGFFYGVLNTSSEEAPLTSDMIRGLVNGGNYNGGKSLTVNASSGTTPKRIVIAVPKSSTRAGLTQVLLKSAFDVDITAQYKLSYINVEGYNKYTSVPYKVWVYEPAIIDSGEIHSIKLG